MQKEDAYNAFLEEIHEMESRSTGRKENLEEIFMDVEYMIYNIQN